MDFGSLHKGCPRPGARCRNINLLAYRACCPPNRGRDAGPPQPLRQSPGENPQPGPRRDLAEGRDPALYSGAKGTHAPQAGRETDSPDALRYRLTPDQHLLSRNHPPRVTSLDGPQGARMSIRYYYQDLLPRPLHPPVKGGFNANPGYHPTCWHWEVAAPREKVGFPPLPPAAACAPCATLDLGPF